MTRFHGRVPSAFRLALLVALLTALLPAALARAAAPGSAPASSPVQVAFATDPSPAFRAVVDRLLPALAQLQVPGAALGVSIDGRDEVATFGVADLSTDAPVTERTLFAVGSITKTFTGTAIMRLVDQGKVDLDAPVRAYVPELRLADESVARRVTVRQLMTHAGDWWGDGFVDTGDGGDAIARYVAEHLPTAPQLAPLGMVASYNNSGFVLLGRVIEEVTGRPYREAIRELLLEPLGLARTTFNPRVVLHGAHITGYGPGANGVEVVTPAFLPRSIDPAGGLWTTVGDLLRYARFHMGDGSAEGRRLMSPETFALMQTPSGAFLDGTQIGLYWPMIALPGGLTLLNHSGETFTHVATLGIVPKRRFAVALLTNSTTAAALPGLVLQAAIEEYLGIGSPGSPPPEPWPAPSPEQLAAYAGSYDTPTDTAVLRLENGTLLLTDERHNPPWQVRPSNDAPLPPDLPLTFVAPDLAIVGPDPTAGLPLWFLRRPDGTIGWLMISSRLFPRTGQPDADSRLTASGSTSSRSPR